MIFVVDDDPSVREALSSLVRSVGLGVELFGSAQEFLAFPRPREPSCLVLDVRLPGSSGLELQRMLTDAGQMLPIIFITGHGDIPMTVRAMKAGAVEFLAKPFRDEDLLDAIKLALEKDDADRQARASYEEVQRRYATLTGRELEILPLIVKGLLNKQVAAQLGISEVTVKVHRRNVMRKMCAASLPDLVRMSEVLRRYRRPRPGH